MTNLENLGATALIDALLNPSLAPQARITARAGDSIVYAGAVESVTRSGTTLAVRGYAPALAAPTPIDSVELDFRALSLRSGVGGGDVSFIDATPRLGLVLEFRFALRSEYQAPPGGAPPAPSNAERIAALEAILIGDASAIIAQAAAAATERVSGEIARQGGVASDRGNMLSAAPNAGTTDFSVIINCRLTRNPGSTIEYIVSDNGGGFGFCLFADPNTRQLVVSLFSGGAVMASAVNAFEYGEDMTLIYVRGGAAPGLYKNGVLIASGADNADYIGAYHLGYYLPALAMAGEIREFRVCSRGLSAAEIAGPTARRAVPTRVHCRPDGVLSSGRWKDVSDYAYDFVPTAGITAIAPPPRRRESALVRYDMLATATRQSFGGATATKAATGVLDIAWPPWVTEEMMPALTVSCSDAASGGTFIAPLVHVAHDFANLGRIHRVSMRRADTRAPNDYGNVEAVLSWTE